MTEVHTPLEVAKTPRAAAATAKRRVSLDTQTITLIPILLLVAVLGFIVSPSFLTVTNLVDNVLALSAVLGILVVAESIILIGGHFDLSLQSTVGFGAMLLAVLVATPGLSGGFGLPWPLALVVTMLVIAVIGAVNGLLIARLKLNAFIVTLAMLILVEGFTLGLSGGQTYTELPDFVLWLGSARMLGIPVQAFFFLGAIAIAAVFMRLTVTGRSIYAMGGSPEAARAAGIRTDRLTVLLFIAASLMALVAGLLLAGKTAAATASLGDNIIFTVFAAAVLGGIDLKGGRGNMIGAGLGVLLLGMIQNILILSNVPAFWINAVYGAIIISALLVGKVRLPGFLRRSGSA